MPLIECTVHVLESIKLLVLRVLQDEGLWNSQLYLLFLSQVDDLFLYKVNHFFQSPTVISTFLESPLTL